jgi:hypothetical protein
LLIISASEALSSYHVTSKSVFNIGQEAKVPVCIQFSHCCHIADYSSLSTFIPGLVLPIGKIRAQPDKFKDMEILVSYNIKKRENRILTFADFTGAITKKNNY